ncbi:DNA methyltransferase [candidate division BRC1 bacterium HGW-BRC1-1]|nr:MAG: DNA methyltransferase [candidate division BRC1 bacterium HGW-BRC1-1]
MARKSLNQGLGAAKAAKQDEFYTQYIDIQKEVEAYLEFDPDTFRGKIVYCNCDDPFESNFFKYFAANFNKLSLKRLITTSYDGSPIAGQGTLFPEYNEGNGKRQQPKALAVIVDHVKDEDGDGAVNIDDVKLFLKRNKAARIALKGDGEYPGGDFRSAECIALLKDADIVVTNPPFSLFREYVAQLVECKTKFLIIGNQNAITYKEIFPLIKDNKLWLGVHNGGTKWFQVQEDYDIKTESRKKIVDGTKYFSMGSIMWFTNLDHGRRHQQLPLMTMAENLKFSKNLNGKTAYDRYDNYDAIEVGTYKEIPSDYDGMMGVPITFLDKYNPDQFEIIGITKTWHGGASKTYPKQIQIGKDGTKSEVTKLNDGPVLKVLKPPVRLTYYTVGGIFYIQLYARVLIRRRHAQLGKGTKK